ncbi:AMP-binding protein [Roseovarius nubinhibens]|jgi:acyl-CoA synthetase (AMP-forming)/AMP-acid ligase II|uniref:class I adenylate-forming enzyme family protein n=1 Tax=Roseovarius nubinhibens TaxID=314263 RepID=UPI001C08302C|nr:AMP-binding protein [Roseovarius nubinhibens]MBU3000125.1 AMP-binding protein [Roseovarius nubinhibens]
MKIDAQTPPAGTLRDWLDHRAATTPDRPAFLFFDGGDPLTWAALRNRARQLAQALTVQDLAKGTSVAILQPNGRAAIESLFGVLYGGFRATVINLVAGDEAIAYALDHCEAPVALVGEAQQDLFSRTRPDGQTAFAPRDGVGAELHPLRPEDDALLMYTSGTTGRPKGVIHSHASLLAGGWTPTIAHELSASDCGLCVLPIYHINGLCVTVMSTLISGGTLAVAEKFSASRFWDQCETARATWFSVVPTIISHLLHSDITPGEATRARLRLGRSASSALSPDVQTAFETRFDVPIIETMGLTETAAQILSNPLPPGVRKIGSPGRAYGNEACILSPALTPLPPDTQGEIAVRGPNVMRGYFKNPEATRDTFGPDGWLRTGDLGHIDADGYVYVTGRLKELIIKGGENIAPREIDEALYAHPDVVEAAAFARPCKTYGERVEAAVRLCDGSPLTEADLIALCHDRLGRFKSPDCIHLLDDLPKGPSGKIQRIKLPELCPEPVAS